MSSLGLNELVGTAVINLSFQARLFNGQRAQLFNQLQAKLDGDEQAAVLNIQAETLSEFAAAIEQLIDQREGRRGLPPVEPVALPMLDWSRLINHSAVAHLG